MQDGIRHPRRLLHIGVAQSSKKPKQLSQKIKLHAYLDQNLWDYLS